MVREIADSINLSPATITNILDRLETRDLATRIRSTQDKRKVGVFLTDKGKEAVEGAPRPLQEHFVERFDECCMNFRKITIHGFSHRINFHFN